MFPGISYTDETGMFYTDEWCQKHRENCLKNFDLSMKFFSLLDKDKFDSEIQSFLRKYRSFKSVTDLNDYDGVSGCYIMVLDEYKQLYVGATYDIKDRIRRHWNQNKSFDRLLFPVNAVEKSVMSIDSFRALDTTRIYVKVCNNCFDIEEKYISSFSNEFLCNRVSAEKFENGINPRDLENYHFESIKKKGE